MFGTMSGISKPPARPNDDTDRPDDTARPLPGRPDGSARPLRSRPEQERSDPEWLDLERPDPERPVTLTYTATGLPAGLSINSVGVISGAITELGTNTVTIIASEDGGLPRSVSFDWVVL